MADYEFQAQTSTGEPVHGTLAAADEASARRELESRGLIVGDLLWCPEVDEAGTLGDEEITTLVHAVGSAAASRAPLELTLAVLAEDNDDPRLAGVARRLVSRLQQGTTIDRAIADLDHELPAEVRGLMRAGIESGDLAGTFARFTQQRIESQRIGRKIRTIIAYPIVIILMTVPIMLLLSLFVIPMFAEIYTEFELDLPAMTLLIVGTAEQLPGLIVGLLLVVLAVPILLRVLGGRWLFHRFRGAVPLFGRLWIWSSQREFAALLASFLDLRLPLSQAVEFTGQLMSDRNVARSCQRVSERLQAGEPLSTSLGHSINFDRTLTSTVAWGESYGLLPDALRIAGELYDDRIEQQLALVRRLLPPAALIGVGTVAIFVVIGLFIPLVELLAGLSQ